jgi:hypothetical protein
VILTVWQNLSRVEHVLEDPFQGHRVAATLMSNEKLAVTLESAILVTNAMVVVIAVEGHFKALEFEAVGFLGVAFGLFDLADQTVVHRKLLSGGIGKEKGTRVSGVP